MDQKTKSELKFKQRSLQDLARFIGTRTEENSNYSLFFGAGCSITSGIRPATELVKEWRNEIISTIKPDLIEKEDIEKIEYLSKNESSWYEKTKEYSTLFEKRYDLQPQRRRFIENEVSNKKPSIGYAYLTSLISKNYFNTIFTTNFDDLLNEAFFQFSDQRPIICAHDSSINGVSITSRRPKIIKLHGDYLFDDIKSTARETESLEQNMRLKFTEFAKDSGLIVLGYSGGDRSIMDVLSSLLRNDEYFKTGIYWCIRRNSTISDELKKLLWKDRVYFIEVDGFDETFAELHSILNKEDTLPISTNKISNKNSEIIRSLIENKYLENSESPALRKAFEILKKESSANKLYELINPRSNSDKEENPEDLDDDELIALMQAKNLSNEKKYIQALELCRNGFTNSIKKSSKIAFLKSILEINKLDNNLTGALSAAEEMIALEPTNPSHHLTKSILQISHPEKILSIKKAQEANPYYYLNHLSMARTLKDQAYSMVGRKKDDLIVEILKELDDGIRKNPSNTNNCWTEKFYLANILTDKEKSKAIKAEIIQKLSDQNPQHRKVLSLRVENILKKSDKTELQKLENDIKQAQSRAIGNDENDFIAIALDFYAKSNQLSKLRGEIESTSSRLKSSTILKSAVARVEREKFGRTVQAAALYRDLLDDEFYIASDDLISCYLDLNLTDDALNIFNKFKIHFSFSKITSIYVNILEQQKRFQEAINELSSYENTAKIPCRGTDKNYFLLCLGNYEEAEEKIRKNLEEINFSLDAETSIINYEFCRLSLGKKIDRNRIEKIINFSSSDSVRAASHLLLNNKAKALEHIEACIKEDYSSRFDFKRWPIFKSLHADDKFIKLIETEPAIDGL